MQSLTRPKEKERERMVFPMPLQCLLRRNLVLRVMQCALVIAPFALASLGQAQMSLAPQTFAQSFVPMVVVSPANFAESLVAESKHAAAIKNFCTALRTHYRRYHWPDDPCGTVKWRADLRSRGGYPLIFAEFGRGAKTTLILGGVHADELTPMHLAFRFAKHLDEHPGDTADNSHVIVAPLVNPDGFLREYATRTNGNGIDVNRNFFTMDWYEKAQRIWVERRQRVSAHFPGYFPNSEIETLFQIQLIDQFQPDKILSIHAPLGFLDYDGPGSGLLRPLTPTEGKAKRLVKAISESSKNYKVVDYEFYPGSLGNYAGNERHIPTVTLELQTTDPTKVEAYWQQFQPGLMQAIHYHYLRAPAIDTTSGGNGAGGDASPFSVEYHAAQKRTI